MHLSPKRLELIDTHCHLTSEGLLGDIDGVIARSRQEGITSWIAVGTDVEESKKVVQLAHRFENMYAAIAIHPHDARIVNRQIIQEIEDLAQDKKVVAIGETGLDYHYQLSPRQDQMRVFTQHLEIAARLNLPVIIHCRKAFDETMNILEKFQPEVSKAVFHCFSGSVQQARVVLDKGFYISFTGVVTFKNAKKTHQAATIVPLDRLMLETDAPYMSPEPVRKQKINEPAFLIHIARYLASLKQTDLFHFAKAVTATSKTFFNLPG